MNSWIRGQELPIFDGIIAFLIKKRRISVKTPGTNRGRPKGTANKPAKSEPRKGERLPS